jgi:hypothetical protein
LEAGVEGGDAVGRDAEAAHEAHVAVAAAAGFGHLVDEDGGLRIGGPHDGVGGVAVGTDGGALDAALDGLAVDAGAVLGGLLVVAHSAQFGRPFFPFEGLGGDGIVGGAVAGVAVRSGGVALLQLGAVNALPEILHLAQVTVGAGGLGLILGVGIVLVPDVARGAGHGGMGRLAQLGRDIMTLGTLGVGGRRRGDGGGTEQGRGEQQERE